MKRLIRPTTVTVRYLVNREINQTALIQQYSSQHLGNMFLETKDVIDDII